MSKLEFGIKKHLKFESENEKFFFIGILASGNYTSIHWEHNEAHRAWGSEGRIHFYRKIESLPKSVTNAFTTGNGNILNRINCNEFVLYLWENFNFVEDRVPNQKENSVRKIVAKSFEDVLKTIPEEYVTNFIVGFNLKV